MFNRMITKRVRQWAFLLAISITGTWITTIVAQETKGGATPQAVFDAAQTAGANKDFNTLTKLVAPSEQAMLSFGTDMAVGMFLEFYEGEKVAELKKKYQEIQKKFDVNTEEDDSEKLHVTQDTPQEVIDEHMRKRAQKLYGHVDAAKYVPELMGIVINMPEMAEQSFFPREELGDLLIDGDKAAGKAGDKKVTFLREDGRWFLTADVMN